MTNLRRLTIGSLLVTLSGVALAQGPLNPGDLLKPLGENWPSYSGDYSGKRYSSLTQVNQTNVKNLTLAWVGTLTAGPGGGVPAGGGGGRGGGGSGPTIVGGEGPDPAPGTVAAPSIKGATLEVNGIL